jgi:hypothetical protein
VAGAEQVSDILKKGGRDQRIGSTGRTCKMRSLERTFLLGNGSPK